MMKIGDGLLKDTRCLDACENNTVVLESNNTRILIKFLFFSN